MKKVILSLGMCISSTVFADYLGTEGSSYSSFSDGKMHICKILGLIVVIQVLIQYMVISIITMYQLLVSL